MKYKINSFFSGVGGIELGFEQTNKFKTLYANEFDKYADVTYAMNHQDTYLDTNDIHKVDPNDIPDCDVIVGGFPCQSFSIGGYRKGFLDARGTLFWEMLRMIEAKKPKVVLAENVKGLLNHDHGKTFKTILDLLNKQGYFTKYKVMNTKEYGNIPQSRERVYIVSFKNKKAYDNFTFPKKINLTTKLQDVIDFKSSFPERYYYNTTRLRYPEMKKEVKRHDMVYEYAFKTARHIKDGSIPTIQASCGAERWILNYSNRIRKMTPKECFNAQGFPSNFILPFNVSNTQLYKQAGNSVSVPVIKRIAENIYKALNI